MTEDRLPPSAAYVRTTPRFTESSVPAGLLRAHQVAADTWGLLKVLAGGLTFCFEDQPAEARALGQGDQQVIPPRRPHHVSVDGPVVFEIEFYRSGD